MRARNAKLRRFMKNGTHILSTRENLGILFDRQRENPQPFRSTPFKPSARPKVTIAIGIISRHKRHESDGGEIILAGESQTTYDDGTKDLSTQKISIIKFLNGRILMVHSGFVRPAVLAIKTIQEKAGTTTITDWKTVKNVIEESMREVRKSLIAGWDFSDDRLKTYLQLDQHFEFLVAFYCDGDPFLLHVDIYGCTACPAGNGDYAAIGVGSDLAKYLIKEFQQADPDFEFVDVIATAVIEKVKANVKDCDGATWVGFAYPDSDVFAEDGWPRYKKGDLVKARKCGAFICRRQLTDALALELKEQEKNLLPKKNEQISDTLYALCKKIGVLVYTNFDDGGDGDAGVRISAWSRSEDEMRDMMRQHTEELVARKNVKNNPPSPAEN